MNFSDFFLDFLVISPSPFLLAIMRVRPVKDGNHEAMFNSPRAGFEPTSIWSPSGNFCLNFSPAFILIPSGHFASELLISLFGKASSSEIECKFLFKYPSFQLSFVLVWTCQEAANKHEMGNMIFKFIQNSWRWRWWTKKRNSQQVVRWS